jgi:ankyrin repeat protein
VEDLVQAVIANDLAEVAHQLELDVTQATSLFDTAKQYDALAHWLYVGDSILHLAAAGHQPQISRLLLAAGADPNSAQSRRQGTPLHYAADGYLASPWWNAAQQTETIQVLVGAGAQVNAQDQNGASPLHRAVRCRCAEAVICLLETGADNALKNKSGSTAFHLAVQSTGRGGSGTPAARSAQKEIVLALRAAGADPAFKDGKGRSVFDAAGNGWVRQMLL